MFWEGSDEGYPDSEVVVTVLLLINTIPRFMIRCGLQVSGRGKAISVTQQAQLPQPLFQFFSFAGVLLAYLFLIRIDHFSFIPDCAPLLPQTWPTR